MVSVSSRRFTMENEIPFVYFFDEATTFKIADFEKMPSVLREYKCSFTFLTQSAAKVENDMDGWIGRPLRRILVINSLGGQRM